MVALPKRRGETTVAFNEWLSYYNVRLNQVKVLAGQEVIVKLKPARHVATHNIETLEPEKRRCFFPQRSGKGKAKGIEGFQLGVLYR